MSCFPAWSEVVSVRRELADNPGGVLETTASQYRLPLQTVVECLPEEMWNSFSGGRFVEVMRDLAEWGAVTVIAHNKDVVIEVDGPVPPGRLGQGFYNLHGDSPLGGHLRADHCKTIVFVRRPFMGRETLSLQFFNAEGEAMFKVFVGRDAKGNLRQDQVDRFTRLQARLDATANVH